MTIAELENDIRARRLTIAAHAERIAELENELWSARSLAVDKAQAAYHAARSALGKIAWSPNADANGLEKLARTFITADETLDLAIANYNGDAE